MYAQAKPAYEFGEYYLDANARVLLRDGDPVPITPKAFDTLLTLVRKGGRVVRKDELLQEVWPDTYVEEATLAQNIFTLRKALGRGRPDQQYIETVPRQGYRFVAEVSVVQSGSTEVVPERHIRTQLIAEEFEDARPVSDDDPRPEALQLSALVSYGRRFLGAIGRLKSHHKATLGAVSAIVLLTGAYYVHLRRQAEGGGAPRIDFQKMRMSKLTSAGKVVRSAVSPDGKYVANVLRDGPLESLSLRQTAATTEIQIIPAAPVNYRGVTFSPDGAHLYYVTRRGNSPYGLLWQVPTLGGTPREVLADVDSGVTFSPDGRMMAFTRDDPRAGESSLVLASVEGADQRRLATRRAPDFFSSDGPAWSPNGESLICAVGKAELNRPDMTVSEVRVGDGSVRLLTDRRWQSVGQVAWLGDGSRIVMDAWDMSLSPVSAQLWQLSYPDGVASRITNDLSSYHGVSVSAAGDIIVSVQSGRAANFWVAPAGDFRRATPITTGAGDLVGESLGVSWAPGDRLVYGSTAGGGIDVWVMNADGGEKRRLTMDDAPNLKPAVSPDGSFVAFVSWRTGQTHLWRIDLDGTDLRQLTDGAGETYPAVSPDGRWVVYSSFGEGGPTLWRVPSAGGPAIRLTDEWAIFPSVSPDGKWIACFYRRGPEASLGIGVIPFDAGGPVKLFDVPPATLIQAGIHWMPDGRGVTYITDQGDASNIWRQPLEGGEPKPLTNFTAEKIFRYTWSGDGRQAAFERGVEIKDAVIITGFS